MSYLSCLFENRIRNQLNHQINPEEEAMRGSLFQKADVLVVPNF